MQFIPDAESGALPPRRAVRKPLRRRDFAGRQSLKIVIVDESPISCADESKGLSEEKAYRLMRTAAMRKKKKIAEIAQAIITAAELFK